MNPDEFTIKAQQILQQIAQRARQEGHPEVTPEHLAAALIHPDNQVGAALLERAGVPPALCLADIEGELRKLPRVSGEGVEPRFAPPLVKILDRAQAVAREFKDDYVAAEHLLLALLREGKSKAAALL